MKVAFFGLPLAALLLQQDGHEIVYAASCRRSALGLRRLKARMPSGHLAVQPALDQPTTLAKVTAAVRRAAPDLLVSWFWTTKLPPEILEIAPGVGVHPSLLPRHRGPDPYFWAIDCGDKETGVTAHRLDIEYDTGAVLGFRTLPIDPQWDAWRLARALDRPSLSLLREIVRRSEGGQPPPEVGQDERLATRAPEPSDADLEIRWSWSAERIERRVRAAAPWPGAWTQVGDHIVSLVRVRKTLVFPRALAPSEAAVRADGIAVVRAGQHAVELIAGRTEDDRPLSFRDLAVLVDETRG